MTANAPATRSKTKLARLGAISVALAVASAFGGCTTILGDFEVAPVAEAGAGKGNGEACQADVECGSGFCTDGVCCESACRGTCESCAIERGKCLPHPAGTDPENECRPTPRPDAGEVTTDVDAGALDGGDAGVQLALNLPEGGVTANDETCAGSCDGNRQCKFPGTETTCGTKFCNTDSEAARFACDGQGRCELELATCQAFACEGDGCRTTCAGHDDCAPTHFCNSQGTCQEKLADSVVCGSPNECKSGFCVDGVCCNSDCDPAKIPGATCNRHGSVGQCKCDLDCGDAGACKVYYPDVDKDGYGDRDATLATGAEVACDNNPPPGKVLDHTDCADNDPRAHPGQTEFFGTPITGTESYDFDCNGVPEKKWKEFPKAICHFCGDPKKCPDESADCSRGRTQSYLKCEYSRAICLYPDRYCDTCGGSRPLLVVGGWPTDNSEGFTETVKCGATSTNYVTCGQCKGILGDVPSTKSSRQQLCR